MNILKPKKKNPLLLFPLFGRGETSLRASFWLFARSNICTNTHSLAPLMASNKNIEFEQVSAPWPQEHHQKKKKNLRNPACVSEQYLLISAEQRHLGRPAGCWFSSQAVHTSVSLSGAINPHFLWQTLHRLKSYHYSRGVAVKVTLIWCVKCGTSQVMLSSSLWIPLMSQGMQW